MTETAYHIKRVFKYILSALFPTALFHEWPFLCIFSILSAPFSFYFLFRAVLIPDVWFSSFKEFSIVLFYAYICARIIVVFKSPIIKAILRGTFYTLAIVQFIILAIAFTQFGMSISPELFTVMLQTDTHEARGFFETFLAPILPHVLTLALLGALVIVLIEYKKESITKFINNLLNSRAKTAAKYFIVLCIVSGLISISIF